MLKTRIPVKECHVRQFVIARYGNNTPVIDLTKKTMLGTLAELACEKIGYRHVLPKAEAALTLKENQFVELKYPDSLKNHFMHPRKVTAFSKILTYLFNHTFIESIETSVYFGDSDYYAVQVFMERYGITEDMITADTLRKKWRDHQRYMAKKMDSMLEETQK